MTRATPPAPLFAPTLFAAQARLAAVRPADYARTRNALDGAVTHLSPYITHGLLNLPQVLAHVVAHAAPQHPLDLQHKFVFELGWREYFRHVWQHRGDGIFDSLHAGVLPDDAYAQVLPEDIRRARTGVPVIDTAVRTLYATGTLHNHARMWLASYVVHLRKVHWSVGAAWLYAHLLDGDLASNHLSWQWVAGTGSHKPYLFNAANVARYAPAEWHSPGSVVDTSYEALDSIARSSKGVGSRPQGDGVAEPTLHSAPPAAWPAHKPCTPPQAADVAGRDVWLVHPWAMGAAPADLPSGAICVAMCWKSFHTAWPWSGARWAFVGTRLAAMADVCWFADAGELAQELRHTKSVHTVADPHVSAQLKALVSGSALSRPVVHRAPQLFAEVKTACPSFSNWFNRSTRQAKTLADLPGLAGVPGVGTQWPEQIQLI
jgi:deoxyribodipyrimidine photo-lyase